MPHKIESATTGRARCRGCKESIAKGELRFGEEFQNPYSEDGGTSFRYWHLACAAKGLANEVAAALAAYEGPIDEAARAEVDALVLANRRPEMPHVEVASSGRAHCRGCEVTIKKGEWSSRRWAPRRARRTCTPGVWGATSNVSANGAARRWTAKRRSAAS